MKRRPAEFRIAQIYNEAARLFVEQGFAATSMSEIARAVGITKAGLYHFVKSKDELALILITRAYVVYDRDVHIPAQGISDPLERLQFIVRSHLYNITRHRGPSGNPVTVLLDDPAALGDAHRREIARRKKTYYKFLRDTLLALKERGELNNLDPTVAAFSLLGMILWLARWHRTEGRLSIDDVVMQMTEIALRGVVRPDVLQAKGILRTADSQPATRSPQHIESPRKSRQKTRA